MTISINTSFFPYKLDLQEKKPVIFDVEVINRYQNPKKVNLEILAGNQIGFNKTVSPKEKFEFGLIQPGENKKIKLDVFPKNLADKGEQEISIIVTEITIDESGYSYPSKKFKKTVGLQLK